MTSSRLIFLCLSLSGCALWHERERPDTSQDDDHDTSSPDDDADSDSEDADEPDDEEIDSPDEFEVVCSGAVPDHDPYLIAHDIPIERITLGPCGELAYGNYANYISLYDASLSRQLGTWANVSRAQFSPDGALFMADGLDEVVVYDLGAELSRGYFADGGGFLLQDARWSDDGERSKRRSVPFMCDALGLSLIDGMAPNALFPGLGCLPDTGQDWQIVQWSEYGSRVLFRDEARQLHVADFATGRDWLPPVESAPEADDWPLDVLHLSSDGQVLVHVAAWQATCGDTLCPMSDGTAQVFDIATQEAESVPALLFDDNGNGGIRVIEGPPSSHRLAIQGPTEMTLLARYSGELESREYGDLVPVQVVEGRDEVLSRHQYSGALELVRFGGATTEITETTEGSIAEPPNVAVSRDGSVIAYLAFRGKRCESNPQLTGCTEQLWEVVVWSRKQGELVSHLTNQPATPLWVGDDGSVLLEGPLAGDNEGFGWGTFVMGTDGGVRVSIGAVAQLIPLADGFVAVTVPEVPGATQSLERFDQATGRVTTLAGAPPDLPPSATLTAWVDRAEERLVYSVNWYEGPSAERHSQLYAGRLAR